MFFQSGIFVSFYVAFVYSWQHKFNVQNVINANFKDKKILPMKNRASAKSIVNFCQDICQTKRNLDVRMKEHIRRNRRLYHIGKSVVVAYS